MCPHSEIQFYICMQFGLMCCVILLSRWGPNREKEQKCPYLSSVCAKLYFGQIFSTVSRVISLSSISLSMTLIFKAIWHLFLKLIEIAILIWLCSFFLIFSMLHCHFFNEKSSNLLFKNWCERGEKFIKSLGVKKKSSFLFIYFMDLLTANSAKNELG